MAIYKTKGIVCSGIKLNEADRIIHIYTTNGLVRAVVKGVRKTKSKFGGRLEPISYVNLILYSGKSLDTVSQAELIEPYINIKRSFNSLTYALAIADFVQNLAEHESHPGELLKVFKTSLDKLNSANHIENIFLSFNLEALRILGYNLEFGSCVYCSRKNNLISFSSVRGGMICSDCDAADMASDENRLAARILLSIASGSDFKNIPAKGMRATVKLIHNFIRYHTDISLRSSSFVDRILTVAGN